MVKKQINVVNLTEGRDITEQANEEINREEAEQLNQIKEEIKKEEEVIPIEPPTDVKPKRKAAPRKKKEVVEEAPPEITQPEEEKPVEKPNKVKTVELVNCPKCKKEMTKRTLRYDHEKTCPGEPIVREAIPVKRRAPVKKEKEVEKKPEEVKTPTEIPNEIIEREVNKRLTMTAQERLQQRMRLKDEKIKKLASQIA